MLCYPVVCYALLHYRMLLYYGILYTMLCCTVVCCVILYQTTPPDMIWQHVYFNWGGWVLHPGTLLFFLFPPPSTGNNWLSHSSHCVCSSSCSAEPKTTTMHLPVCPPAEQRWDVALSALPHCSPTKKPRLSSRETIGSSRQSSRL